MWFCRKDFKIYMTKLLHSSAALDTVREGWLARLLGEADWDYFLLRA